jgi:hypothetical protein
MVEEDVAYRAQFSSPYDTVRWATGGWVKLCLVSKNFPLGGGSIWDVEGWGLAGVAHIKALGNEAASVFGG